MKTTKIIDIWVCDNCGIERYSSDNDKCDKCGIETCRGCVVIYQVSMTRYGPWEKTSYGSIRSDRKEIGKKINGNYCNKCAREITEALRSFNLLEEPDDTVYPVAE